MKATGIVRRVDDLGRIVIPKEIRRTLRIREGDPLEIYTEKDGGVIFRKYSPMGDLQDLLPRSATLSAQTPGSLLRFPTGIALSPCPVRPSVS
jgi:AbrB family transcriptional regulator (stage V sporulation protein T)